MSLDDVTQLFPMEIEINPHYKSQYKIVKIMSVISHRSIGITISKNENTLLSGGISARLMEVSISNRTTISGNGARNYH